MGKRELTVLKGINLEIQKGELVAIMGPSGSGKTTLLNLLGCLDKPTSGKYFFEDKEVSCLNGNELARIRGQKIGFIFQTFNLLSRLTALSNVELGMTYTGQGIDRQRARDALTSVGLSERMGHRPVELSGGEQQRVAIARAVVIDLVILVADEPTGDLDRKSAEDVLNLMERLNTELKKTIIMVTHDPHAAQRARVMKHLEKGVFNSI
jgi:putative ABC transport system ATP-binding protein